MYRPTNLHICLTVSFTSAGKKPTPKEYESDVMDLLKEHTSNAEREVRLRQPDLYSGPQTGWYVSTSVPATWASQSQTFWKREEFFSTPQRQGASLKVYDSWLSLHPKNKVLHWKCIWYMTFVLQAWAKIVYCIHLYVPNVCGMMFCIFFEPIKNKNRNKK